MLALAGFMAAASQAEIPGPEATLAVETLECGDIRLQEMNLQAEESPSSNQYVLSATEGRIDIDYAPARYDIVSQPVHRVEDRTAAELNARFSTSADLVPFAGVGGYRGFTDFRSVWLDEYYRQLFTGVPGYAHVAPQGWHAMAGGRWSYVPGSAILQLTLVQQGDTVSPGYEPQIGAPLLRGRASPVSWFHFAGQVSNGQRALPAPSRIPPTPATKGKQHQKNNQYGRHFSPSLHPAAQIGDQI